MSNKPRIFQARTLMIVLAGGAVAAAAALAPRHASLESTSIASQAPDSAIAGEVATAPTSQAPAARLTVSAGPRSRSGA